MAFAPQFPDAPNVFPFIVYRDAVAAIDFLERAFGFERISVLLEDGGRVDHAELRLGTGIVMLGGARPDQPTPDVRVYISISDLEAHFARAVAAGAEIVAEPYDTHHGPPVYAVKDPEGNSWYFGTYQPT